LKKQLAERVKENDTLRGKNLENERIIGDKTRENDELEFKLRQAEKELELLKASSEAELKQKIVICLCLFKFIGKDNIGSE
jgi:hypothetical protein